MLPFDSESGRGFGSVFHHHNMKSQPLSGWDFFCPFPQCWRGFRAWALDLPLAGTPMFWLGRAVFLSPFSAGLLTEQVAKSCVFKGLRAVGCGLRLL